MAAVRFAEKPPPALLPLNAKATAIAHVSDEFSGTLSGIDTATNKVAKALHVIQRLRSIGLLPEGKRFFANTGKKRAATWSNPETNAAIGTTSAGMHRWRNDPGAVIT